MKLKLKLLFFIVFLTISLNTFSQNKTETSSLTTNKVTVSSEMQRKLRRADKLMDEQSYYNAIELYKDFEKTYPGHDEIVFKIAISSYITRDYKSAEIYFVKYIESKDFHKQPEAMFYYAETLKALGKYEKSQLAFIKYSRNKSKEPSLKKLELFAKNEINAIEWVKQSINQDSLSIKTNRLLGSMNRAYSDFSPFPISHDTLLFASMPEDSILSYTNEDHHFSAVKLYEITKGKDSIWSEPFELNEFNTKYEHTANGVIAPDGKYFYLTRCKPDRSNKIQCELCYTEHDEDKIKDDKVKRVKGINSDGYTFTQPTFQTIEKKDKKGVVTKSYIMYFVSDRPGGQGGKDIWYAVMEKHGKFKKPVNCGSKINTPRDEVTPYYNNSTNELYFSSNYHFGFGGQDIFKSKGKENKFSKPENVLFPLNSSYDDTYYIPVKHKSVKEDAGYLVSNRPGGIALHSETCCDDIYYYIDQLPEYVTVNGLVEEEYLENILINKDSSQTRLPSISNAIVIDSSKRISSSNKVLLADTINTTTISSLSNVTLQDTIKQVRRKSVSNAYVGILNKKIYSQQLKSLDTSFTTLNELITWVDTTSKDGDYKLRLKKGQEYIVYVKKDEYKSSSQVINTRLSTQSTVVLNKKRIKSGNVAVQEDVKVVKFTADIDVNTVKVKDKFVLDNLHFDSNSDVLKEETIPTLQLIYDFLVKNPKIKIELSGHTDSKGSDDFNLDLSQRRSESVVNYLVDKGIDEKRLHAKGYGETQPVLANENTDGTDNPDARKLNRRTEVKIISH